MNVAAAGGCQTAGFCNDLSPKIQTTKRKVKKTKFKLTLVYIGLLPSLKR